MFILSFIFSGLEVLSGNYTSLYEHYQLKVFQIIKLFGEIPSDWPNALLRANVYKTLESWW